MTGSWKLVDVHADDEKCPHCAAHMDPRTGLARELEPATPPDEVLERMARAFLDEYSATGNEIASISAALSSLTVTESGE